MRSYLGIPTAFWISLLTMSLVFSVCLALQAKPDQTGSVSRFRIVQISDTHINASDEDTNKLNSVINEINSLNPKPDFVLSTGDCTDTGSTEDYIKYKASLTNLHFPVYHTIGNHEVKWSIWGKTGITHFFNQKPYYSFDYKGIHFVILDTNIWMEHNGFIGVEQLGWLQKDLEKVGTKKPVILFFHHMAGYIANEYALLQVIQPYNVRLGLGGHDHGWGERDCNGTAFQWTASTLNDPPCYRILDIDGMTLKSYRKEVGKDPVPDGQFSIQPVNSPIKILSPTAGKHLSGETQIVIQTQVPMKKVEVAIDGCYTEARLSRESFYVGTLTEPSLPGHHVLSVRTWDEKGMPWEEYIPVTSGDNTREVWQFKSNGSVQAEVTYDSNHIFFGCWGGDVYCLDASTSQKIWHTSVKSDVLSQIAIQDHTAYVGTAGGELIALNSDTGKLIWKTQLGGPIEVSPVVQKDIIYVGSGAPAFYAINRKDGKIIWKTPVGGMCRVKPLMLGNKIFFGCWDNSFYALDSSTGKLLWKTPIGQYLGYSPANCNPVTDGTHVFVTGQPLSDNDPDLYCLDPETGKIVWSIHNPGKSILGIGGLYADKDRLYAVAMSGEVLCFSPKDGSMIWSSSTSQEGYDNTPISAQDLMITCGLWGGVYAHDQKTGKSVWSYSTGRGYLFGPACYGNNRVFVPSLDGSVTCLKN